MKLWEAIKAIEEDGKKEFIRGRKTLKLFGSGSICIIENKDCSAYPIWDDGWERVKPEPK